jgi:hypothetical protein
MNKPLPGTNEIEARYGWHDFFHPHWRSAITGKARGTQGMVTRQQIDRLAARVEGLLQSSARPKVVCIWKDCSEIKEQALERHYADRPGDRAARSIYVFS